MSNRDRAKMIRALFAAYLTNDRKAVEDAFTHDFRFTSPYDDSIDKATSVSYTHLTLPTICSV